MSKKKITALSSWDRKSPKMGQKIHFTTHTITGLWKEAGARSLERVTKTRQDATGVDVEGDHRDLLVGAVGRKAMATKEPGRLLGGVGGAGLPCNRIIPPRNRPSGWESVVEGRIGLLYGAK